MTAPECHGEVCITCSDQAVAVRVVELLPHDLAMVDTGSGMEEVSIALVSAGIGDEILVHAKEAIAVLGRLEEGTEEGTEKATDRVPE
jgi:hydrogenase expression/formation protein HypC